ncbi:hypothetical protein D3C75_754130 [compost metagenome]
MRHEVILLLTFGIFGNINIAEKYQKPRKIPSRASEQIEIKRSIFLFELVDK